jgi:two-component system, LytTR family, response regulator
MIKTLLVDDEANNLSNLEFVLNHDCVGIEVMGKATSAKEAREFLKLQPIEALFLDINMPIETGFDLLTSLPSNNYKVIFVTAYNEYSLQAIKANAIDYILKPVRIEDVQQAVLKLHSILSNEKLAQQSQMLLDNFLQVAHQAPPPKRIALPQLGGITYLDVDDIVSLQADGNYTIIHKRDMQKMVVTRTMKDFEDILDATQFIRIHKSYMVNLQQVHEYSTEDGGVAKMNDGNQWSISRRQLEFFLEKMSTSSLLFKKGH